MATRINLLPDPRFAPLQSALEERMIMMAGAILGESFGTFLDPVMKQTADHAFQQAGAHEGTIWMCNAEETHLVPVFNNGPRAAEFVGAYQQPLTAGIISMVFASEQPFCENDVYRNAVQDKTLDRQLGLHTCGLIAVPFHFAKRHRGVISCVTVKAAESLQDDPPGFTPGSLMIVQSASLALSRLVEGRLLGIVVGWQA